MICLLNIIFIQKIITRDPNSINPLIGYFETFFLEAIFFVVDVFDSAIVFNKKSLRFAVAGFITTSSFFGVKGTSKVSFEDFLVLLLEIF